MAVGEHLGRSEMVLVDLANAEPLDAKQKQVNISAEQRRAEDLLEENRLYRQTALEQGDTGLANILDELERVLLDVAHSPQEVTPAQLDTFASTSIRAGFCSRCAWSARNCSSARRPRRTVAKPDGSTKQERNKT